MFGYLRPVRDELKVRELQAYEAAYCGLCKSVGRRSGFIARCFLNYDMVFLAMLLSPQSAKGQCRCPVRLWCRKKDCVQAEGMDIAADVGTILSYWKLQDTILDGGFWARLEARFLCGILRPGYLRAVQRRPDFDQTTASCLARLQVLETENVPSLDQPADAFACILQNAAPTLTDSRQDRALRQLLYHIGRWIYLLDAWDDLEEDRNAGRYNPISSRFPGAEEENQSYLRTTLRHSRSLAASAAALLTLGRWEGIVQNILYLGLPAVEELVFTGRWRNIKRNRSGIHE